MPHTTPQGPPRDSQIREGISHFFARLAPAILGALVSLTIFWWGVATELTDRVAALNARVHVLEAENRMFGEDIREIKSLLRDIDRKLDDKADK
ncbi:hypothetical protein [Eilatimonas milleporae]|uniref:Uncharacterized protein n=1 Tax=Eilatimonas milleporae TaxID=911205 RepID=A0A3M0CU10_9PROT|nr:hypothetical protein [Eilatimonas milleporae]RMB11940.1 hypothetical protein BXY39_0428 [Eilatimonas milleporae]